jgi:hypothetical protein
MDLYNLSSPAYLYLMLAIISNVLSLFILPFNCREVGAVACIIILLVSILLTAIFIYLITWAIDALYQSGYTILSWIFAIVVILFSLIDLANVIGNMPSVSSSSTSDDSTSDKKTDTTNDDWVGGISQSKGNTTTSGTTSGFTDSALDIYSNPTGSYIGK